jgi:sugar diacid utilization regulator
MQESGLRAWRNSYCLRALAQLYRQDKASGLDSLRLLYVYLANERNTKRTSEELFMHRNNVIYRIRSIEQQLSIDLGDASLRFKLLFAYHFIELYGEEYLESLNYPSVNEIKTRSRKSAPTAKAT